MIIYLAKVKYGENVTIRAFKTKTSATKAAKEAQKKLYADMEYNKTHDMQVDANAFGVVVKADPNVKHKKEKVTTDEGKDIYYVNVYGKDGTFYYHKFAGYVKKLIVEH